jgi:hypothetical protein
VTDLAPGWTVPDGVADLPPRDWPGWEVAYDNDVERGKRTTRRWADLPGRLPNYFHNLYHPDAVWPGYDVPGLRTDPHLHGAGLHVMDAGAWLQVHVDYEVWPHGRDLERRINEVVFLNPEWRPEWGGQLLLCDPSGRVVKEIEPRWGRVAAFECGPASFHGVRQISSDAPPRVTAANYLLAPARPTAVRTRATFLPNRQSGRAPAEVSL